MSVVPVSAALLERYNQPGPRYTSYPTVPAWSGQFGSEDYREALEELAGRDDEALSLYVHLPFCSEMCHYCGCNSTVTRKQAVIDAYLDRVEREISMVKAVLGPDRRVLQLHWGGGTPNFLNAEQRARLVALLAGAFRLADDAEISIEIDPRLADPTQLRQIRELGFNRISLGIQDFNPAVQEAIGRRQTESKSREVYQACREADFESVNLDLVYGLPGQSMASFTHTIDEVAQLRPDRLALYSYAHVPWVRSNQKQVDEALLPSPTEKFSFFHAAVGHFSSAGYEWVGMDHFALPDDELSVALRERRLHRNFMGYTTRPASNMLAFGNSGIGDLVDRFVQNESKLGRYQTSLDEGRFPVQRGHRLSEDDRFRRRIIVHLICNLELPYELTQDEFGASVDEALPESLERMQRHVDAGLARFTGRGLEVTELGRFFIRNLCMELDAYLPDQQAQRTMFSKTV